MKAKRPVNLDISTIELPLAALTSIAHRISGVIVFVGLAALLYLFNFSLTSEESFTEINGIVSSAVARFILWGILSALAYHLVAGCKHLLMDLGVGETKAAAPVAAKITIVISAILIVLLGVWLW